jgi:hypothetical protein
MAASHLPSASWLSRAGRTGSVSTETTLQEAPIKYYKCPTNDTKRRQKVFRIHLHLALQKQMKQQMKLIRMQNESENRQTKHKK